MSPVLFVVLIFLPAVALAGLLFWRFKSTPKQEIETLVATTNHKSVKSFHYGPAPVLPPPVAGRPLAKDDALSQLMPEEDFKQKQKEIEEANRLEAEEAERREAAEAATQVTKDATSTAESALEQAEKLEASRNSPQVADATVSVLDTLSVDTVVASKDEELPDTVYDNPLGAASAPPTKNDISNRAAEIEVRKQQRAARQKQSAVQKDILTSLLAENK